MAHYLRQTELQHAYSDHHFVEFLDVVSQEAGIVASTQLNQSFFRSIEDLRADLLSIAEYDGTIWSEWRWRGTARSDGRPFDIVGILILRIVEDRVVSAQLLPSRVMS